MMLMVQQCWVLFVLKWTLIRRSWSKRASWGYVFLGILLFLGALLSLVISVSLYSFALYIAREDSSVLLLLLLKGAVILYLFFYAWGVLMDLQRADLIDFRKMLLLPISLPVVYLLNFFASVISPIMLFAIPGLVCLLAGLYPSHGASVFWAGIPLALLFMFMMSAWAYYFRGRLAIIMENKRHRRMALVILPLCFVMLGQLPAFLSHLALSNSEQVFTRQALSMMQPYLVMTSAVMPPFWPAYGLWSFITGGSVATLAAVMFGLCLCTLLGLRLGYVSTLRHYMGLYNNAKGAQSKGVMGKRPSALSLPVTGRRLPGLANDTSALTLAFYHSFGRHPHIRMMVIMPLCLGLFFLFMYRAGAYGNHLEAKTAWMPMAALAWPFFNFSLFMFNVFGVDASSLYGLILFPVQRRKYFIAKNLALAPFVLGLSFFFIAAVALLAHTPMRVIAISLILSGHLYLMFCIVGNFLSVRFPYRINRDALRQPTGRLRMLLMGIVSTLLALLIISPASSCMLLERVVSGSNGVIWRNISVFTAVLLFGLTLLVYLFSTTWFGDQFTARERAIFNTLNMDRE